MQDGSNLIWIFVAIGAILFVINLFILVWAMHDAESRGKSGCLVALLILILHIPELIIWLLIRPEKKIDNRDQPC